MRQAARALQVVRGFRCAGADSLALSDRNRSKPRPKRPPNCDTDWAFGLTLSNVGRAEALCAGDTIWQRCKPVLEYGATWRKRGFICHSAVVGLTCRNTAGGGFFLSRERWRRL